MIVDKFVENLNDDARIVILEDYEKFRRDGMIGDCVLRSTTEQMMSMLKSDSHVVLWMEQLAMACYRYYGQKYITEYFNIQLPA